MTSYFFLCATLTFVIRDGVVRTDTRISVIVMNLASLLLNWEGTNSTMYCVYLQSYYQGKIHYRGENGYVETPIHVVDFSHISGEGGGGGGVLL